MCIVIFKTLPISTVVLIVTSAALASVPQDRPKPTGPCVLPEYPEHGSYSVTNEPNAVPGQGFNTFELNVTCNHGYGTVEESVVHCNNGTWSVQKLPQCIQFIGFGTESYSFVSYGHTAHPLELPWHASIYKKTTSPYMQICGGSLVSSNVVISAAHCFWSDTEKLQPASRFAIAVGKLYRPWNDEKDFFAQKSDVHDIKIPVRFRGSATNYQEDIAIVRAVSSFTYNERVNPVSLSFDYQLDEEQLKEGNFGLVGGWGLTGEDDNPSQVLKAANLPYVDIDECINDSPPSFTRFITCDKICAGYMNGTAVCRGDSGGGLVFLQKIGDITRNFLRGIVSTAPGNNHACNIYTWATFTHVINHERFILSMLHTGVSEVSTSPVTETI